MGGGEGICRRFICRLTLFYSFGIFVMLRHLSTAARSRERAIAGRTSHSGLVNIGKHCNVERFGWFGGWHVQFFLKVRFRLRVRFKLRAKFLLHITHVVPFYFGFRLGVQSSSHTPLTTSCSPTHPSALPIPPSPPSRAAAWIMVSLNPLRPPAPMWGCFLKHLGRGAGGLGGLEGGPFPDLIWKEVPSLDSLQVTRGGALQT